MGANMNACGTDLFRDKMGHPTLPFPPDDKKDFGA
jgi:hypothetical protein